jgi:hypothetical protein
MSISSNSRHLSLACSSWFILFRHLSIYDERSFRSLDNFSFSSFIHANFADNYELICCKSRLLDNSCSISVNCFLHIYTSLFFISIRSRKCSLSISSYLSVFSCCASLNSFLRAKSSSEVLTSIILLSLRCSWLNIHIFSSYSLSLDPYYFISLI